MAFLLNRDVGLMRAIGAGAVFGVVSAPAADDRQSLCKWTLLGRTVG